MRAWRLAGAYIGSVIGAGFASGQEVLRFFGTFGSAGYWGMAVAGCLFTLFGYAVLERAHAVRSTSHCELLEHLCGAYLGRTVDILLNTFLFASLGVMLAGAAALLRELWGVPPWAGVTGTALVTAWTIRQSTERLTSINGVLVGALLAATLIAVLPVIRAQPPLQDLPAAEGPHGMVPGHWFMGAVLYAAFNVLLAASPLGALGAQIDGRREAAAAAFLGGGTLWATGLILLTAILKNIDELAAADMPVLSLLLTHTPHRAPLYGAAIMLALFTSCITAAHGLAERIAPKRAGGRKTVAAGLLAAAVPIGFVGFSQLVQTLYPVIGYVGLTVAATAAIRTGAAGLSRPRRNFT